MLLPLLLAAAPVDLNVLGAGILAPSSKTPIGAMVDLSIVPQAWTSPTVMRFTHESAQVKLDGVIDLSREGTYVEASATRNVVLTSTGQWLVVLKRGAKVPLVGRAPDGLRIGFQVEDSAVVPFATVPDDDEVAAPVAAGPEEKCAVSTVHARADLHAPKWKLPSFATSVHRGPSSGGWAPAWVDGPSTIVHGFVHDADVQCDVGTGGGLGLSGIGGSSGDGIVDAREGLVPAGTVLFAGADEREQVAVLKAPARGLLLESGAWYFGHLKSGSGELRLSNVFVGKKTVVELEPSRRHGVGGSSVAKKNWPRLKR